MTARILRAAGLVLVLAAGAVHAAPEGQPDDPVKLVRTLEFLQDTIAEGTADSGQARRKLIDFIGQRFKAFDPATWKDRRNADAAVLYVLSGGNPAVLWLLPQTPDDKARTALVAAVAAYATGSRPAARKLWEPIDVESLPLALVAPAALVKANLIMDTAPKEAMHYADIARLEAPGTLIEEAATRRAIEIAAKLGRTDRFEFYAAQYASRFPRSMYGGPFLQRFAESYLAIAHTAENEPRLDNILAPLRAQDRRRAYIEIARLAIIEARLPLAQQAAKSASALATPDTADQQRAELYRTAALALTGELPQAKQKLASLKVSKLGSDDRGLLKAVSAVVGEIERWPSGGATKPSEPAQAASGNTPSDIDSISTQARKVMASAEQTLAGARE